MTAAAELSSPGWQARLTLRFGARAGRTVMTERRHQGPLQVQRAFYPEGPQPCHVYVLHPPGGLVAGDALDLDVAVTDPGAGALITMPGATKVYRGDDRPAATVRQRLAVAAGASLEWLPQETILFDGARADLQLRVDLDEGSRFLGWEILCLGRPAVAEALTRGTCRQGVALWRAGRPLCLERARFDGGAPVLAAAWGLAGAPVTATLFATPASAACLPALRALELPAGDLASATLLDDLLVCRYLGPSAERARRHFASIWKLIRPSTIGRPAHPPRIWST
jgi:urease accessory protein